MEFPKEVFVDECATDGLINLSVQDLMVDDSKFLDSRSYRFGTHTLHSLDRGALLKTSLKTRLVVLIVGFANSDAPNVRLWEQININPRRHRQA